MLEQLLTGIRSFFLAQSRSTNPEERRQLVRVRSHIPVQVKLGDRLQSGVVSDLGVQGMRLRCGFKLKAGSQLPVVHSGGGAGIQNPVVHCKVAWCRRLKGERRYSAGVIYNDTPENMRHSWVAVILRELGLDERTIHERREYIRAAGQVAVNLHRPPDRPRQSEPPRVEAVNVGVGGLLLRSRHIVHPQERYLVEVGPFRSLPPVRSLSAEVVKCTADTGGGGYLIALRFLLPDANQVRLLGNYVMALLREG